MKQTTATTLNKFQSDQCGEFVLGTGPRNGNKLVYEYGRHCQLKTVIPDLSPFAPNGSRVPFRVC